MFAGNVRQSWKDAMKSILLPVDQNEQMPSALETARLAANLFDSTVEGVALCPAFAEIVAPDPIVAIAMPPHDWNEVEFCRTVRAMFDAYAAQHPAQPNILAEARAQGADLLIKGAYTQSRLRQMIFGGATQHVLSAAELPVLLTH
jgi:nucleotide-binding universal stress UspA family protein